ncbi:MAG: TonB-dependent receptor [Kangiellaceae bacterium]
MISNTTFKRTMTAAAITVALGLQSVDIRAADASSGGIYGDAPSGEVVTIKNKATGFTRSVTVKENGSFNFSSLPVGNYIITAGEQSKEITITIGTNISVDFDPSDNNVVQIIGQKVSRIDTSSVESTSVFTADQLAKLPVAQDITSVALLAPGTVRGDQGTTTKGIGSVDFSNLASFGGSSVAENGYFINGFDVTNIRNFVSFATLPFDALEQQQVKTGGYGAEYGRSLGGVVNIVTKSGSNEWEFGGAVYYSPDSLRGDLNDSNSRDPDLDDSTRLFAYNSDDSFDRLNYNLYAGGPIVQDKLFIFGMFEGRNDKTNIYLSNTSESNSDSEPNYLVKLDWNISDDHLLEYTHINNTKVTKVRSYDNPSDNYYTGIHGDLADSYSLETGGKIQIAKYTGYLSDNLIVTGLYGTLEDITKRNPASAPGDSCPVAVDSRDGAFTTPGCWVNFTVRDLQADPDSDERESLRLSLEYSLDDHTIRLGYDSEEFTSYAAGTSRSGGVYWRYFDDTAAGVTTPNGYVVRKRERNTVTADFRVENKAIYLEDSWDVTDSLVAYIGLRHESFANFNGDNIKFVDSSGEIAPRLGFSYDMSGDSTQKLFGTWGRYFIPVASNTNIRASGSEISTEEWFEYTAIDPVTWAPTLGDSVIPLAVNGSVEAPDPRTVAATNLSPMFQDEFILGYQQELDNEWIVGAKYINREVKDGMDDYCSHQVFADWAAENGYDNFDTSSMASCMMMNPGKDFSIALDLENDGNFTDVVIPAERFGLEAYKRTYNALEFSAERVTDNWSFQTSYTYAKSEGNSEGYVNSTQEQDDAGLTQDLDHALFQHGADGYLPNDRRHSIKAYGAYAINDELSVSANFLAQSGRPISCTGWVPLDDPALGEDAGNLVFYGASSFYCVDENGVSQLGQRGNKGRTPWTYTIDLGASYQPSWADNKLTLRMDILNLFDFDKVTSFNEQGDIDRSNPRQNPNFLTPNSWQAPREVRLSARFKF